MVMAWDFWSLGCRFESYCGGIFLFLLKAIEYHYYSKKYSSAKEEVKRDNRGIKIIKDFLLDMYKKFGDVNKKKDNEWDAEQVADNIGEIISPIPAFGSFLGARGAPTSII